jgi:Mg-chelatase subunit ChlD
VNAALAPLLLLLAGAQEPRPARPSFGAEVEVVQVDVAVSRKGRAILGLTAEAFEVRDNGVVQDVELVSAGEMPLSVVLVLDTSASVAGEKLKRLRGAAGALLDGLAPGDLAALITFSQMVRGSGRPRPRG